MLQNKSPLACQLRWLICLTLKLFTNAYSLTMMNARTRVNVNGMMPLKLQLTCSNKTSAIHTQHKLQTWVLSKTVEARLKMNAQVSQIALMETLKIFFHQDHSVELAILCHTQKLSCNASTLQMKLYAIPIISQFATGTTTAP
jgi:hypothetical protein